MTPTPETLREIGHRLAFSYNEAVIRELEGIDAAADAWEAEVKRLNKMVAEFQNGVLVELRKTVASEQARQALEEWIKLSVLVAQMQAYGRIEDESWLDKDWTEELPSGQWDIWQTFDIETRERLAPGAPNGFAALSQTKEETK